MVRSSQLLDFLRGMGLYKLRGRTVGMYIAMCVDVHISVNFLTFEHGAYETFSIQLFSINVCSDGSGMCMCVCT